MISIWGRRVSSFRASTGTPAGNHHMNDIKRLFDFGNSCHRISGVTEATAAVLDGGIME